jgi:hypothetical protein
MFYICSTWYHFLFLFFFFYLADWSLNSGLELLARQMLYHLGHAPSSFWFSYFSDRVSCFCPGLASDSNLPTSVSCIAGKIDVNHHDQLVIWDKVLVTLGLGWLWHYAPVSSITFLCVFNFKVFFFLTEQASSSLVFLYYPHSTINPTMDQKDLSWHFKERETPHIYDFYYSRFFKLLYFIVILLLCWICKLIFTISIYV